MTSFRSAAILPGELSGCRVLGCPQSPTAPLVAFPPIIPSMQSPCDEGRRPSALIMSHPTSFGKSLAEGPSVTLGHHCHPQ